jgi:general stress protein YciG
MATNNTNNPGQFQEGSERAREAGRKGGEASSGKFQKGSQRASDAGRKGGSSSSGSSRSNQNDTTD